MNILPINYTLTFEPDLEKLIFRGKEIITFELKEKAKQIVLDAVDLNIHSVILASDEGARPESNSPGLSRISGVPRQRRGPQNDNITSFKVDDKNEKLFIYLSQELKQGEYKLFIEFQGILNDKLAGFYRSKYTTPEVNETNKNTSGVKKLKEKYLATTQFEAADARRAFPCIDHPSYKATFDVSLIVDKDLTAISNTLPINVETSRRDVSTKKIIRFERTPLMSTYLLYFGVGEFEFIEDKYKDILIRIVATPGKSEYGRFAIECAKKSLEYFEEYFDFPYPLKKLDLIAIPDFASGAMENWGAITFRENALLFYPEKSSKATGQRIAEVVAHEIAHQWFGNLVTMKWWDDLWLNESFATYMAYKTMNYYWPEWQVWDQYITDTVFEAMALDSLQSSHPIKVKVKHIAEIDELFDEIAYEKGGSILRMLDLYLGEKIFRDGLRNYIKKYQYKNAETYDLWKSFKKVSDKPVIDFMEKYITQVGFPKVKIELKNNIIRLRQRRFLFDEEHSSSKQVWSIPYHLVNGRGQDGIYLIENRIKEIKTEAEITYLNINKNYSGFFISNYSKDILDSLGKNVDLFKNSDKLGLIHDLFALILSGEKELKDLYRCIDTFFVDEKSSIVLHYVIAKLTGIFLLLQDETSKKLANKFSKKALEIVNYEHKKNESILDTYLRVGALSSLTLFDDKGVALFVNKQFIGYLENDKLLHPDLRSVVYSSALWFDERNYTVLKKSYEGSPVQEEKAKLLSALGFSKNKNQIKETLQYIMTPKVAFAFLPYAVSSVARNPYAKEIVLDWLMMSWSDLVKRSGGLANMLLRRILQSIVPICGIGKERQVESFLNKNKVAGLERTVEQVLEELRINSKFVNKYKK